MTRSRTVVKTVALAVFVLSEVFLLRAQIAPVRFAGTSSERQGQQLLAVIGIETYAYVPNPARNALRNALDVSKTLAAFGFQQIVDLSGPRATKKAIEQLVEQISPGSEDDLVVYFAGHGTSNGAEGYLVPVDGRFDDVSSLVAVSEFLKGISSLRARHILVIFDACESGIAVSSTTPKRDSSQGDPPVENSRTGNRVARQLITSASATERASALGIGVHSLFTGVVINELERGDCDIAADGYCTATEIGLIAQRRVSDQSGFTQTPVVGRFGSDDNGELVIELKGAERERWKKARTGSSDDISAYLRDYSNGVYATAARHLLETRVRAGELVKTEDPHGILGDKPSQRIQLRDHADYMWIPRTKEGGPGNFWFGETEVTVRAYTEYLNGFKGPRAPGFNPHWKDLSQPMVNVSLRDAEAYCIFIRGRLPTSAEWEYASRAGRTTPHPWYENSNEESPAKVAGVHVPSAPGKYPFTAPVKSFPDGRNDWLLFDVIGNVREWAHEPRANTGKYDVMTCGGSYADSVERATLSCNRAEPFGSNTVGFRCLVDPVTQR